MFINDAEVITPDVDVDNGVVHAIDKVLNLATASLDENTVSVNLYPNPATEFITVTADQAIEVNQHYVFERNSVEVNRRNEWRKQSECI